MASAAAELRRAVDAQLREQGVYDSVTAAAQRAAVECGGAAVSSEELLRICEASGVIDAAVTSVTAAAPPAPQLSRRADPSAPRARYLHLRIVALRSLLIADDDAAGPSQARAEVCVSFGGHRWRTKPVTVTRGQSLSECDDDCLLRLPGQLSAEDLLQSPDVLHCVVMRTDTQEPRYVSETAADVADARASGVDSDWRRVLCEPGPVPIELPVRGGAAEGITASQGAVAFEVELMPGLAKEERLEPAELTKQREAERDTASTADRETIASVRRWQEGFAALENLHGRVFSPLVTLHGGHRRPCVPSVFVTPTRCDRLIDSPLQAARIVSLLPSAGKQRARTDGVWAAPHTVLCAGGGEAEKACLLASLLKGCELDAWVSMGIDAESKRAAWVLTRAQAPGDTAPPSITFWDPVTGTRYHAAGPMAEGCSTAMRGGRFRRLHSCFNDTTYAVSLQADDAVGTVSYDFADKRLWRQIDRGRLFLRPLPSAVLQHGDEGAAVRSLETAVEKELMGMVTRHRDALGFQTVWDGGIAPVFAQALWTYEQEKLTGTSPDRSTFSAAMGRVVPRGRTLRAFPVNFSHRSPARMLSVLLTVPQSRDILTLQAEGTRLALRVRATSYCGDADSVWVMVAATYPSVL